MYSVRMRAEKNKKHISGVERLVGEEEISSVASILVKRALSHEKGKPDFINISVEALETPIKKMDSLPIILTHVKDAAEGKALARKLLLDIGIPHSCIEKAIVLLEKGPADGESMRGAIIMDMRGNRLEPDKHRGIRASRMDITREAAKDLERATANKGLSLFYSRISEALVLATKVASVKGTVAELCWSDDPSYPVGYVASKKTGYIRIPFLKKDGDSGGGRVFFVDDMDLDRYIHEMEKTPILIEKFGGLKEIMNIEQEINK